MIVKKRKRLPGWAHRVNEIFKTEDRSQFEIGVNDCFTRFVQIEIAMYGHTHWAKYLNYTQETSYEIRKKFKTKYTQNILARMYKIVMHNKIRFGDFAIRSNEYGVPVIYFYDGKEFKSFLPNESAIPNTLNKKFYPAVWRI